MGPLKEKQLPPTTAAGPLAGIDLQLLPPPFPSLSTSSSTSLGGLFAEMTQTLIREGSEPLVAMLSSGITHLQLKPGTKVFPPINPRISKLFLLIPRMQQQPYLLMMIRVIYSATLHLFTVLISFTSVTLVAPFTGPLYQHWEGWEQVTSSCPAGCWISDSIVESFWWAFIYDIIIPTLWDTFVCSSPTSPHPQSSSLIASRPLTQQPNHLPQLRIKATSLSSQTGWLLQCLQLCPRGGSSPALLLSSDSPEWNCDAAQSVFSSHQRIQSALHESGLDFFPLLGQLVTGNSWPLVWGYREVSVQHK